MMGWIGQYEAGRGEAVRLARDRAASVAAVVPKKMRPAVIGQHQNSMGAPPGLSLHHDPIETGNSTRFQRRRRTRKAHHLDAHRGPTVTMNAAPLCRRPLGCLKTSLRQARQQKVLFGRTMATATETPAQSTPGSGALPDHNFCKPPPRSTDARFGH